MKTKIEILNDIMANTYAGTSGYYSKVLSGYTKDRLVLKDKRFINTHLEEAFIAAKALGIDYDIEVALSDNEKSIVQITFYI